MSYVPSARPSNRNDESIVSDHAAVIDRIQQRYAQPRTDRGDELRQSPAPLGLPSPIVSSPEVGSWVQVQRGTYAGDIGFVNSIEVDGVYLLLVPRLAPPVTVCLPQKRKQSFQKTVPKLFTPADATRHDENTYSFNGCTFEHGLLVKYYDSHSVSTSISSMPLSLFCLFRDSCHPKLVASESTFPKPSEWEFQEGEEVCIRSSNKRGTVTAVQLDSVEVNLATGEGDVSVSWMDIRKVVSIGDYVEVTSGEFRGLKGWVHAMRTQTIEGWVFRDEGDLACVVKDTDGRRLSTSDDIEVCQMQK